MNLWWFNHHARPPVVPGITRHYNLAKELTKYGIDTTIIHSSCDHLGPMFPEGEEFGVALSKPILRNYSGVKFLAIPTTAYKGNASLGRIRNMYDFYKRGYQILSTEEFGKPDMIIGSVVHTWGALCGFKLSKKFRVPFVYEVRDLWPLTLVEVGKMSRFNPLVLYFDHIDKNLARAANLIITSAPLMKEYYKEKLGIADEKFLWITNGTDINSFPTIQKTKKEQSKSDKVKIYYTGTLGHANALDDLLNVISQIQIEFPNIMFYLIGNGPQKSILQKRITKEKLNVVIQDPVPKKNISELLNQADAFFINLMSSPIYNYGISINKLADYHAAGKPILMVGDAALNPVIESGGGFVFKDFIEFKKGLKHFLELSEKEKITIGRKAQDYARKNYSWENLAESLQNALFKIS